MLSAIKVAIFSPMFFDVQVLVCRLSAPHLDASLEAVFLPVFFFRWFCTKKSHVKFYCGSGCFLDTLLILRLSCELV